MLDDESNERQKSALVISSDEYILDLLSDQLGITVEFWKKRTPARMRHCCIVAGGIICRTFQWTLSHLSL